MAYDILDFQAEVIERSRQTPVLVDFWAPWCGPCRVLGPTLEKLASKSDGKWVLAKVNTDAMPELSVEYGIRGIPAVKLFVDGQVVDEFTGALPEYAVAQWLEKALPSENKRRVLEAEALLGHGDVEEAELLLERVLQEEPTNPHASMLLAQIVVFDDPDRAEKLAETAAFEGPAAMQVQGAVNTIAHLSRVLSGQKELPDDPVKEKYLESARAIAEQNFDLALSGFIDVIQRNRYYDDDGARKACVALFTLLGEDHPITLKHRRMFNMVLY